MINKKINLTDNLSLIQGNIFLTQHQTITITVNCVGKMGKGLALTAKNLFPEVNDHYENLCKNGEMKMGFPVLYNKKITQLCIADDNYKSLLLFPTKNHWKQKSEILGIERGLVWLVDNYHKLEIKSLAISALGCGNGGLDWRNVGPIMYRYLKEMDIPIDLYLPGRNVSEKYLTVEYLSSNFSKITDFSKS